MVSILVNRYAREYRVLKEKEGQGVGGATGPDPGFWSVPTWEKMQRDTTDTRRGTKWNTRLQERDKTRGLKIRVCSCLPGKLALTVRFQRWLTMHCICPVTRSNFRANWAIIYFFHAGFSNPCGHLCNFDYRKKDDFWPTLLTQGVDLGMETTSLSRQLLQAKLVSETCVQLSTFWLWAWGQCLCCLLSHQSQVWHKNHQTRV